MAASRHILRTSWRRRRTLALAQAPKQQASQGLQLQAQAPKQQTLQQAHAQLAQILRDSLSWAGELVGAGVLQSMESNVGAAASHASSGEWELAYASAMKVEQTAAVHVVGCRNKGVLPETEPAALGMYYCAVLLAAIAAASVGKWRLALAFADWWHLEAAPPPPPSSPAARLIISLASTCVLALGGSGSSSGGGSGSGSGSGSNVKSPARRPASEPPSPAAFVIPARLSDDSKPTAEADATPTITHPIRRIGTAPSLEAFRREHFLASEPVVLTGAMDTWPCVHPQRGWADLRRGFLGPP